MKNNILYFWALTWNLFYCIHPKHPQEIQFLKVLKALDVSFQTKDTLKCLVIPNGGCQGCISNAEAFVFENIDKNPSLFVIFTSVNSQKTLKTRLGRFYRHPRIKIDSFNHITTEKLQSIYPIVYHLVKGRLVEVYTTDFSANQNKHP